MSDFKKGLEAAARLVEEHAAGTMAPERVLSLMTLIRNIEECACGRSQVAVQGPEALAFEQFKTAYKPLGFRNNWVAARKKFDSLVKKERIDPAKIVAGAVAYAGTRPARQYVPAPEVFLNKRQFDYDWANSSTRGPSPVDVERFFQDRVDES